MARESDPSGGTTPIPKWFLGLIAALAVPIVGAAIALYVQLAQLGERQSATAAQLTRIEATLTATVAELRETARTTALQSQAQAVQSQGAQRQESRLDALEIRTRELERVCLPRR